MNAVIYTDGSARPNPGFIGGGIHGYFYNELTDDNKKRIKGKIPSGYEITDIGYLEKTNLKKVSHTVVNVVEYIDCYLSFENISTNNIAEGLAITNTIDKLVSLNVKSMLINSDSSYAIGIFQKLYKNPKDNGNILKTITTNPELWEEFDRVINLAFDNNIPITIKKVPAHTGHVGNERADMLALIGHEMSKQKTIDIINWKQTETKEYWMPNTEKHPLTNFKQMYFTNTNDNVKGCVYNQVYYKELSDFGKMINNVSYSITILPKAIEYIEMIKELLTEEVGSKVTLFMLKLDLLYDKTIMSLFNVFGKDIFLLKKNENNGIELFCANRESVMNENKKIIAYEVLPPGLSYIVIENIYLLRGYLSSYINEYLKLKKQSDKPLMTRIKIPTLECVDITKDIYDDKHKLQKKVSGDNVVLKISKNVDDINLKFLLQVNKDILSRNNLKRIEKDKPLVWLVIHKIEPKLWSYFTIVHIEEKNEIIITSSQHANTIILV